MRYLTLRHTPVTSLLGTLSLAASLFLAVVAAPAGATPPAQLSSQEKVNFEIAIKSDEELTTTITITSPASREKNLKEDCVQETFSQAATPPDITFTNDNGTPTCKATFTTPISRNNYVSHDGDEYVVDTHDDSAPKDGSADTFSLTVIFPGKVTESGGGKIEGDQQNEVSFSTFYGHKARGQGHRPGGIPAQLDTFAQLDTRIQLGILIQFDTRPQLDVLVSVVGCDDKHDRDTHCDRCCRSSDRPCQQHTQEEPGAEVPGCAGAAVASGKHSHPRLPAGRLHLLRTGRPAPHPARLFACSPAVPAPVPAGTDLRTASSTEPQRLRRLLRLRTG